MVGFMKYAFVMDCGAHVIHTKFHKYWFRHSKVDGVGIHRHTDSMQIS
jgi:hypothetical protein